MNHPLFYSVLLASLLLSGKSPAQSQTNAPATVEDTRPLQPQDKLLFKVDEDPIKGPGPEFVFVSAQSEASFKVSRGFDETIKLNVRGKTLAQVQQELKSKLESDYYKNATVDLRLQEGTKKPGQVLYYGRGVRGVPFN